jgi:glycosyltransferase involved in cell wall biosynthesis
MINIEENKPKISIITVVFNGEKYLEETIQSIINQTYENIEYIIIDGGSTDGTIDIIKKYEDKIDYWISKSDKGIYDAMNKGIDKASGEWINFMNAGDIFYNNNILEKVFDKNISKEIKCIYGDVLIDYDTFNTIKIAADLTKLNRGMQFSHQSLFVNSNYHKKYKFDIQFKSAADYNFIYTAYINKISFLYKNLIISKVKNGGLSDIRRLQSLTELKKIVLSQNNTISNKIYLFIFFLKINLIYILKKIIPIKLTEYIQGKR